MPRVRRELRWPGVLACVALAAACGGSGSSSGGIEFGGSVNEIVLAQTADSGERPARGLLVRLREWLFPAEAVAQSESCPEEAREVLICAATLDRAQDCEEIATECRPMNAATCRFAISIAVHTECTEDGRRGFAFPFFVQDVDGDGERDEEEPSTGSLPFACTNEDPNGCSTCNGDEFFWQGVSVDFEEGEAGAAVLEKRRDGCGPTPTPDPSATPVATPTPTPLLL